MSMFFIAVLIAAESLQVKKEYPRSLYSLKQISVARRLTDKVSEFLSLNMEFWTEATQMVPVVLAREFLTHCTNFERTA